MAAAEPDHPERLGHPLFCRDEPVELLIDRIEALWTPITVDDDWSGFEAMIDEIELARTAWGLQGG